MAPRQTVAAAHAARAEAAEAQQALKKAAEVHAAQRLAERDGALEVQRALMGQVPAAAAAAARPTPGTRANGHDVTSSRGSPRQLRRSNYALRQTARTRGPSTSPSRAAVAVPRETPLPLPLTPTLEVTAPVRRAVYLSTRSARLASRERPAQVTALHGELEAARRAAADAEAVAAEAEAWAAGEAARELEARESMLLTARGDAQR